MRLDTKAAATTAQPQPPSGGSATVACVVHNKSCLHMRCSDAVVIDVSIGPRRHIGGIHNVNNEWVKSGNLKMLTKAYSQTVYATHTHTHTQQFTTSLSCCNIASVPLTWRQELTQAEWRHCRSMYRLWLSYSSGPNFPSQFPILNQFPFDFFLFIERGLQGIKTRKFPFYFFVTRLRNKTPENI